MDEGRAAQATLERIAALGVVRESAKYYLPSSTPVSAVSTPRWDVWANRIPFTLAQEQQNAINEILQRHYSGRILRHCLSGDVGTGKTAVYGTVAATALSSGQRVAIMLPNETLARQTYTDLSTWWPELCPRFISGSSKPDGDLRQNQFLIGTQALLFANLGKIDLLIVDEQQKFSREQREKLLDAQTGLLEVTATCIPRSQALIRFGTLSMSKLRQGHVQKTIHTRIWRSEGRRQLMFDVRQTIEAGAKVLVVYPKRDRGGQDSVSILPSAEEAFSQWDRLFPDKVRLAHGGLDDNLNEEAILDLRSGKASILVSTSLVEVGINIPNLRRCVVVHAERFGLSTLHQMRGRVARDGGVGYCDLMLPNPVKEDVDYRLQILEATSDGFEVAEHDMAIRGFGNLAPDSERQSGFDETFLFGRPLKPELLDAVLNSIG